jgi:hypothetical protein
MCVSTVDERRESADSIQQSLNLLPSNARFARITFGTNVSVYELDSDAIRRAYICAATRNTPPAPSTNCSAVLEQQRRELHRAIPSPPNFATASSSACNLTTAAILDDLSKGGRWGSA